MNHTISLSETPSQDWGEVICLRCKGECCLRKHICSCTCFVCCTSLKGFNLAHGWMDPTLVRGRQPSQGCSMNVYWQFLIFAICHLPVIILRVVHWRVGRKHNLANKKLKKNWRTQEVEIKAKVRGALKNSSMFFVIFSVTSW